MNKIGVVEGFFGPEWSHADRLSYAPFLQKSGGGFYIYAPKRDAKLRRQWRESWNDEYINFLSEMRSHFAEHKISFGIGLSPFELGHSLTENDKIILNEKINIIQSMDVEILGVFFDDMPSDQFLAQAQIECIEFIEKKFSGKIVFCPSYYTPDPILEKVFGKMPNNYWDDISKVSEEISLAWTGPKVISETISIDDMDFASSILKRSPYLWENVFANDGPKNCKFLKVKSFSGRENGVFGKAKAVAFNMMNQPQLSKILFLASRFVLEDNQSPDSALLNAINHRCSKGFAKFLIQNKDYYNKDGLDRISDEIKREHIQILRSFPDLAAIEIISWLEGKYIVGAECLTD